MAHTAKTLFFWGSMLVNVGHISDISHETPMVMMVVVFYDHCWFSRPQDATKTFDTTACFTAAVYLTMLGATLAKKYHDINTL